MIKKIFILSICVGIFSFTACMVYDRVYHFALETDFSRIINPATLAGLNVLISLLAGILYWILWRLFNINSTFIFRILFMMTSFGAILIPLSASLPFDIKNPELFPGFAIPMLFFPIVGWFTLEPFFLLKKQTSIK